MTTGVLSILNGSSLFLQTRRTTIKAWMSLNSVKIPSPIMELASLEHLKLIDYVVAALVPALSFDWIYFIISGNKGNHKT